LAVFVAVAALASAQAGLGPEKVKNWSDYIEVSGGTHHLFYWFFESRTDPANAPFVIWLTGGPGCSGMIALFRENGPYQIQEDLSLTLNPYSWNSNANVIWIDQPVGAGFSYSDRGAPGVSNEVDVTNDLYEFLQTFFYQYPQYANMKFFIFGESYAGHYVPALSAKILNENNNLSGNNVFINYQGSAIGNGLVDPLIQFQYYAQYAYDYGVITESVYNRMEKSIPACTNEIAKCNLNTTVGRKECSNAYTECNTLEMEPVTATGVNQYDVRIKCEVPGLCYNFTLVSDYLSQPSVMQALGVTGHQWSMCNTAADLRLVYGGDWMTSYAPYVPQILGSGKRVLVYEGEFDFICNWYGGYAWVENLSWAGSKAFKAASNSSWVVDNQIAGFYQSAQNLTFLKVKNAGHMVPLDQPENALDMFTRFTQDLPFSS
jgi:carboxypeptidase C (cathepsin A)